MFAYIFVGGFPVFQGQKTDHSWIFSASLWFVVLNLRNSVQISIILFLYPLFGWDAPKITV